MLHVVLPLKDLVAAKTRLSGLLSPSERRGLMQAMAEDVLAVLGSHPAVGRLWLVSDDPGAALLAEHFRVNHLAESALGARGLNAVLEAACRHIDVAADERIMVLHADLPWLKATDVDAAIEAHGESGGLLLAPDRCGTGTNLLLFSAEQKPPFRFGQQSCQRHREWAANCAEVCRVLQRRGTACDIDQPADLAELLDSTETGPATAAWINQSALRARLLAVAQPARQGHSGQGDTCDITVQGGKGA